LRMRAKRIGAAAAILCSLAMGAAAQAPKNDVRQARRDLPRTPTVAEAAAFLDDAEARLFDLGAAKFYYR
jgi:hypothetical protein